jgi:hypothetical protein
MTPEWVFDKAFEQITQIKRTAINATIRFFFKIISFLLNDFYPKKANKAKT